jgi:hypothetical protein
MQAHKRQGQAAMHTIYEHEHDEANLYVIYSRGTGRKKYITYNEAMRLIDDDKAVIHKVTRRRPDDAEPATA